MSSVPKPRRRAVPSLAALPPSYNGPEGIVFHIPPSAFTFDGFVEWVTSDDFPDNVRVTFVDGEIYLDPRDKDLFLHIPASAHTFDGFCKWVTSGELPEKMRVTFVNGEITLDMSQEELETHNKVKTEIMRVLGNLDPDAEAGTLYTDGVLITNKGAKVSNNPDGVYLTRASRVRLVRRKGKAGQYLQIEGAPDWVMEVVSDSSVRKDRHRQPNSYHKAGIREYWLIDARGKEIDFHVLVWDKKGYASAPRKGAWQQSPVFGRLFRLTRKRDEDGDWQYRLDSRPVAE